MSGLTGRVRTAEGWPVPNAVLTVTDMSGRQIARTEADETGTVRTEPLPAGMHTAVLTAVGFEPVARIAQISATGSGALGEVMLTPSAATVTSPPPGPSTIDTGLGLRRTGADVLPPEPAPLRGAEQRRVGEI